MIEINCKCGGLLYQKGIEKGIYTCVRCGREYTSYEINRKWHDKFMKKASIDHR